MTLEKARCVCKAVCWAPFAPLFPQVTSGDSNTDLFSAGSSNSEKWQGKKKAPLPQGFLPSRLHHKCSNSLTAQKATGKASSLSGEGCKPCLCQAPFF